MSTHAVLALIVFAVGSVGLVVLSRRSLRDRRTHGFYRFCAFESLLGLIVLNATRWFDDPLSVRQIMSWAVLLVSIILAVHGFRLLRVLGRPGASLEDTTQLVTGGAYRWIRHPLYLSLLCLAWGAFLKHPSLVGGALVAATSAFLVATAKVEEAENLRKFGEDYARYMRRTRMFLPLVY